MTKRVYDFEITFLFFFFFFWTILSDVLYLFFFFFQLFIFCNITRIKAFNILNYHTTTSFYDLIIKKIISINSLSVSLFFFSFSSLMYLFIHTLIPSYLCIAKEIISTSPHYLYHISIRFTVILQNNFHAIEFKIW